MSSRSRVASYQWHKLGAPLAGEEEILSALTKAKARGVVTEYDSDTSFHAVWLNGHPGAELRAIRDLIDRLNPGTRVGRGQG